MHACVYRSDERGLRMQMLCMNERAGQACACAQERLLVLVEASMSSRAISRAARKKSATPSQPIRTRHQSKTDAMGSLCRIFCCLFSASFSCVALKTGVPSCCGDHLC